MEIAIDRCSLSAMHTRVIRLSPNADHHLEYLMIVQLVEILRTLQFIEKDEEEKLIEGLSVENKIVLSPRGGGMFYATISLPNIECITKCEELIRFEFQRMIGGEVLLEKSDMGHEASPVASPLISDLEEAQREGYPPGQLSFA